MLASPLGLLRHHEFSYGTACWAWRPAARCWVDGIDPFTARRARFPLGVIYGAFATEVFRGAFQALDRGQIEAGRACGMGGRAGVWRRIMPQAWRFCHSRPRQHLAAADQGDRADVDRAAAPG